MKKVGLKALLFTLICMMIYAGSALAVSVTDHVSVAPNGKGDVLIFPAYFTGGGWESKLVVTNTSETESVVAKVIIRSKERSQELRDFMIFLSPADVWTGILYADASGMPYIRSTDDSCRTSSSVFVDPSVASSRNGQSETGDFEVYLENACTGDTNALGYVEVIEAASWSIAPNQPGVAKADILTAYNAWLAAPSAATANNPINVLAGQIEISNTINSQAYSLNATTLKNYDYDITNTMTIGSETYFGQNSNNSLGEVEAALAKDNLVVPYYAQTLGSVFAIVTFPTKLAGFPCGTAAWRGPFSGFPSPQYSLTAYDLQENTVVGPTPIVSPQPAGTVSEFPSEVNYVVASALGNATFDEGWMHINGTNYVTATTTDNLTAFTYTGLPMIASSMRFDSNGNAGWLYNAHSDGSVTFTTGATDQELNYTYWNQGDSWTAAVDYVNFK